MRGPGHHHPVHPPDDGVDRPIPLLRRGAPPLRPRPEHLGATSSTYGKGREAVADRVTGSLARRKAEARRNAESPEGAAEESDGEVSDDEAEQQDGDAVDAGGRQGKGR